MTNLAESLLPHDEWLTQLQAALAAITGDVSFKLVSTEDQSDFNAGLRMSSIGDCARRQWARVMALAVESNEPSNTWPNLMGYAGQSVVSAALTNMGYKVFDEEISVSYAGIAGHIDGKLTGHDLGARIAIWDSKIRSAFGFRNILKHGLPAGDPVMWCQLQGYIAAEEADLAIVTILPFDYSTNRSLMAQYKVEGNPLALRVALEPDLPTHELIAERAEMLRFAIGANIVPEREHDPEKSRFPCPYCEVKEWCITQGSTDFVVTPLLEEWNNG